MSKNTKETKFKIGTSVRVKDDAVREFSLYADSDHGYPDQIKRRTGVWVVLYDARCGKPDSIQEQLLAYFFSKYSWHRNLTMDGVVAGYGEDCALVWLTNEIGDKIMYVDCD